MFTVLKKRRLSDKIYLMDVLAPRVAKRCQPGEFVIVKVDKEGERIPLTIADYDREAGWVSIVFQVVGEATKFIEKLNEGEAFMDFVGPLGNPSELVTDDIKEVKKKNILFIAGGVGVAPVYPQVKWLHKRGIKSDVVLGARSADLMIFEEELRAVAGELYLCSDDGSKGVRGLVTDVVKDLVLNKGKKYDLCVVIGPVIMMKFSCMLTKELNIPTIASMNPIMVDGTGMCGACRLTVGGAVKFACVDGPEFDGHLINFDEAMKRQKTYKTEEGRALLKFVEQDTHHGGCGICGGAN